MVPYDSLLSSDQLWPIRSSFGEPWLSDMFSGISPVYGGGLAAEMADALFPYNKPEKTPTPPGSGGSTDESAALKQPGRGLPPTGRLAKRKSRASKRVLTTFIIADPSNFRQMVQQVTGVNPDGTSRQMAGESRLDAAAEGALKWVRDGAVYPALDASAFLLDGSVSSMGVPPPRLADAGRELPARNYFDSFSSFPTLESWKADE